MRRPPDNRKRSARRASTVAGGTLGEIAPGQGAEPRTAYWPSVGDRRQHYQGEWGSTDLADQVGDPQDQAGAEVFDPVAEIAVVPFALDVPRDVIAVRRSTSGSPCLTKAQAPQELALGAILASGFPIAVEPTSDPITAQRMTYLVEYQSGEVGDERSDKRCGVAQDLHVRIAAHSIGWVGPTVTAGDARTSEAPARYRPCRIGGCR